MQFDQNWETTKKGETYKTYKTKSDQDISAFCSMCCNLGPIPSLLIAFETTFAMKFPGLQKAKKTYEISKLFRVSVVDPLWGLTVPSKDPSCFLPCLIRFGTMGKTGQKKDISLSSVLEEVRKIGQNTDHCNHDQIKYLL